MLTSTDISSFYERFVVLAGKPTNSREGLEWACSCPQCGGEDRASFWESGRFCCVRGCQAHASNPYGFCIDVLRYDHQQAATECDDMLLSLDWLNREPVRLPLILTREEPPCSAWQEMARAFCQAAEKCLWGPKGETARAYLHSRGLTDQTVRQAHLGLCPDWYKAPLEQWGLDASQLGKEEDPQIKIPRGIVIPWQADGHLWKIQLRRPVPGPDGKKYKEILGSSDCLYNVDTVRPGQPVLLTESELDALSASQEAGDLVSCVATGSAARGLARSVRARLVQASCILQCFDDDRAGERGALAWSEALQEKVVRWLPLAHDINAMLCEDPQSVRPWIIAGLQTAEQGEISAPDIPPALPVETWPWWENHLHSLEEQIAVFQSRPCISCGQPHGWMIDPEDGLLVCPCILQKRALLAL